MTTTFLVPKNNAASTLSAGINSVVTSIPVVDAAQFPSIYPFHVTCDNEIIRVDGKSGNNLTPCVRGQEGTSGASHLIGAAIDLRITAKAISDLNAAVNALEGLYLSKSAAQSNNTISGVDITELTVPIAANQILHFHAYLICSAVTIQTGIRHAINGPAIGAGQINATLVSWPSVSAISTLGLNAYEVYSSNTASNGLTSRIFEIFGIIENGANAGTFALRFRSEVAGNDVTVHKGSWMQYFLV